MMIAGFTLNDILAFIGAASLVLMLIKLLFEVIPKLGSLRANAYRAISERYKHRGLEKRAIAANIENVVNDSVGFLQKELPVGWISKARIEWVREESLDDLEDDDLILRMKPIEDQDENLMNGIFYYFTKALFRGVKEILPRTPRKAAVLQLSRRTITKHHPYAIEDFERGYLEAAIGVEPDIAFYLGHYNTLDQRGFFTGVYLREITALAEKVRFTAQRSQIADELKEIIDQISTFIEESPKAPEERWYRKTDISSYGLLLVAMPAWRGRTRREQTYVNRAKYNISKGINRFYVLGANRERSFVRRVIRAIANQTPYTLVELFELNKDYRGESGGLCAIFDLTSVKKESEEEIAESFEEE